MKNLAIIQGIEKSFIKKDLPPFRSGDTLKVHLRVIEGDSERIQIFQGVVIAMRGSGLNETFTIRKVSFGVGIERIFPVHSPRIAKIEAVRSGKVRRAKLYYLRDLQGKSARLKEKVGKNHLLLTPEESSTPSAE